MTQTSYVPENADQFEVMLCQFRTAESPRDLQLLVCCWVLDSVASRKDIVVALGLVERERGWK